MKSIRMGVIGAGYMGKAHAIAYKSAATVFDLPAAPACEMIATTSAEGAAAKAEALGFRRSTGDWRALVEDPEVDAVNVSTPPATHLEMVLAALAAGKPVFCEKPLGMKAAESLRMAEAAEAAGLPNLVGYNYIKHPASRLAREMIEAGEIGEILHVRATHNEDYLHGPEVPGNWRVSRDQGSVGGALSDVGCHVINAVLRLAGPIESLVADLNIVQAERPDPAGGTCTVENPDQGHFLARFANGAMGSVTFSRVAAGRKMAYAYEITGTRGAIAFDQERMGELHYFKAGEPAAREGFKRILIGPEHPDFVDFCLGAGHGLGYNDQIVIEARDFVRAIVTGEPVWPTFRDGYEVDRVVDAVLRSRDSGAWVAVSDI